MTDFVAKLRVHRTLILQFGPAALTLTVLSLAKLIGVSNGGALISVLSFLAPVVGVVSIVGNPTLSGFSKLVFVVLYYPLMLVIMFVLGLMFGCGALKMFCW